ncbi:MAG TPA: aldo/keto reductase [Acidimicrobiales bacterium]
MQYRNFGSTGIKVSNLCLGAMMFGTFGNPDHEDSIGIIHAALDAGINFVDTADMYSAGESEEIVGKALQGRRDDVILATKVFMPMSRDRNHRGNSRRWIIRECEDSLRRLQTEWIDLYQVHRPDVYTNIDETLGALSDLIHQGKVRYIGSSTFPSEEIVEAQWVAERRGRERFISEQPPYSIFARGIEAGILPVCQRYEMGVLTWSPLNSGWLTGRYRSGATADPEGRSARTPEQFDPAVETNQRKLALVDQLLALAEDVGAPLVHVALAFVLRHPAVSAAIIGPRTMEQLVSQLPASDLVLDNATMDRIDALVPPGTNVSTDDAGHVPPSIASSWRRRR